MKCNLCPVSCGAERETSAGACSARRLKIAKYYLHPFEEPPISFKNGSGCIFFCGCSLGCAFCQNFPVSRSVTGKTIDKFQLADIFRYLESAGAENINLVTPTQYLRDIAGAFEIYRPKIPVVYNTHGYENAEGLKIAEGFTDIYLTDVKFIDPSLAARYTSRADYAVYALPAARFMAQKPLKMTEDGKMLSGCIVRHLVLPQAVYDSLKVIEFVKTLPESVYFSVMSQYTPCGEISSFPELNRGITRREYNRVLRAVKESGLKNVYVQDISSADCKFIPEWDF